MEFHFDINKIFKNNISRIGKALLPAGFVAKDRRDALDATTHIAEIIDKMGQASGAALGLATPVTSADRFRYADDQVIYLMTENEKNGVVVGMLKIGIKSLYVSDKFGETHHVNSPCVLDFYIHESRQRTGLGKILFDYMLEYENLKPEQLALDGPSEKQLSFLRKHYALKERIPQANNFVINEGFFDVMQAQKDQIVQSKSTIVTPEPDRDPVHATNDADIDGVESLAQQVESLDVESSSHAQSLSPMQTKEDEADAVQEQAEEKQMQQYEQHEEKYYNHADDMHQDSQHRDFVHPRKQSISSFHYNKGQMGSQNISSIVLGDDEVESPSKKAESLEVRSSRYSQSVSPVQSKEDEADAAQEQVEEKQMQQYEQHEVKYYNHADDMHQDSKHRDFVHPRDQSSSTFHYNRGQMGSQNISSIVLGDDGVKSPSKQVESLDVGSSSHAHSLSPMQSKKDEADAAQEQVEEKQMQQYEQHEVKYYNHADDMHQDSKHRDFVHPREQSSSPFHYNKQT